MNVEEYLKLRDDPNSRSVFGVPRGLSAGHGDLLLLDLVLCQHPQWVNLVELGTGSGLTSLYIGISAKLRGGTLHTYDHGNPAPQFKRAWPDCISYHQQDLLSDPAGDVAENIKQAGLVIFDNGDKVKEMQMYLEFLQPGCGFLVHDWGQEVRPGDMPPLVERHNLQPFLHEEAVALQSKFRGWVHV